jgi:hypothetical protein
VFQSILNEISITFSRQGKPRHDQFFLTGDFGDDSEYGQIARFLVRYDSWRDIGREELDAYIGDETAILTFLSPFAFRYYLPAFLSASLRSVFVEPRFTLSLNLSLCLEEAKTVELEELVGMTRAKFEMLTVTERQVVRQYLNNIAELETDDELCAESALRSYWADRDQVKKTRYKG